MPGANPAKCPSEFSILSYVVRGSLPTGIVVKPSRKPDENCPASLLIPVSLTSLLSFRSWRFANSCHSSGWLSSNDCGLYLYNLISSCTRL